MSPFAGGKRRHLASAATQDVTLLTPGSIHYIASIPIATIKKKPSIILTEGF
jgi:hypothetical protein